MKDNIKIDECIDTILSYSGGFVRDHLYEVFGKDGCGKTTFACLCIAAAQRQGLTCGYIEVEYIDKAHAEYLGVDIDKLDIRYPETAEEALSYVLEMLGSEYDLIILDSVAGMVTEAQRESQEVGETGQFAQIAGLLGRELSKIKSKAKESHSVVLFTNQIRAKFDSGFGFGPKTDSFGGHTLKHNCSARFEIARVAWIKYGTKTVGAKLKLRAPHKNRFACPNQDGYVDVIFDHDITPEKVNAKKRTKLHTIQGGKDEPVSDDSK